MDPASPLLKARDAVRVNLVDRETGQPIAAPSGFVRVFQFTQSLFSVASGFPIRGQAYDPATPWTFAWPGFTARGFNWGENRVLVKATAPGYLPDGVWFSIYDVWDQIMLEGRPVVEITLPMSRVDAPLPTIALVAPAAASAVENGGTFTLTLDLAATEGLREATVQTPDGFPVCQQRFYGVGVLADRMSCTASLFGTTGQPSDFIVTLKDQARRTVSQAFAMKLVDTTGPVLTLFPSWGPSVLNSREPTQALIGWNDISGVDRYQLALGSQVICAASVPVVGDPAQALCPWVAPRIADNTMSTATLTLTAWDRVGNMSSISGSVTIDTVPPTLEVLSPAPGMTVAAGTDVAFVVDVRDAGGMDSIEVVASGQALCFEIFAPFTCVVSIPPDWSGGKTFHVNAYDAAMNKTTVEVNLAVQKAR